MQASLLSRGLGQKAQTVQSEDKQEGSRELGRSKTDTAESVSEQED